MESVIPKSESTVFIPMEAWSGNAPDTIRYHRATDIGTLAEGLIFYDRVIINVDHRKNLLAIIDWFHNSRMKDVLIEYLKAGILVPYNYGFTSAVPYIEKMDTYDLINICEQSNPRDLYRKRVIGDLRKYYGSKRSAKKLIRPWMDSLVIADASNYGPAVKSAKKMVVESINMQSIMQSMIDAFYDAGLLSDKPDVSVSVSQSVEGKTQIKFNLDFDLITNQLKDETLFGKHSPFVVAMVINKLLLSVTELKSDLMVSEPMYGVLNSRLDCLSDEALQKHVELKKLSNEVELPDVRKEVMCRGMSAAQVIDLRKNGKKFRDWLRKEVELKRDASHDYTNDFVHDAGMADDARRLVSVCSPYLSLVAGSVVGSNVGGDLNSIISGLGSTFVSDFFIKCLCKQCVSFPIW